MHRIDTSTRHIDKFGPGRDGFTDGNPATGEPSTQLNARAFDNYQEEIARVIERAGMQLDPGNYEQLYAAILQLIADRAPTGARVHQDMGDGQNFDLNAAGAFTKTIDRVTTFTFTNCPQPPFVGEFSLNLLDADSSGQPIIWFDNILWVAGQAPALTNHDIINFFTLDGGQTWFAFYYDVETGGTAPPNQLPIGDGVTWTPRPTAPFGFLNMAYGNGTFVATNVGGTDVVATSPNGITWTSRAMPSSSTLNWQLLAFGNGTFVAMPRATTVSVSIAFVATSTDGVNWTQRAIPAGPWVALGYANDKFIALGSNQAIYSADGISWLAGTGVPPATQGNPAGGDISFGNGTYIGHFSVGANASDLLTSTDGINWIYRADALPAGQRWDRIAFGNNVFVATAQNAAGANTRAVATSVDGITWTLRLTALPVDNFWHGLCFDEGKFVAVGYGATAAVSTDGITWQTGTLPTPSAYWGGVFGARTLVAFGFAGPMNLATSP